jgi:hypothetical protein
MTCDQCGASLQIGQFPFCPHEPYGGTAIGDEYVGGFVQENFGHEPETFYSKQAMLKRADALGLRLRDQWAGPGDRYLSNWASVSAKTLTDARVLLERVGKASTTADDLRATLDTATFTVRDLGARE